MKMKKLISLMIAFAAMAALVGCAANPYANRGPIKSSVADTATKQSNYPVLTLLQDPTTVVYGKMYTEMPLSMGQYGLNPQAMFNPAGVISRMQPTVSKMLVAVLVNQAKNIAMLYVVMQGGPSQEIAQGLFQGQVGLHTVGQSLSTTLLDELGQVSITLSPDGTNSVKGTINITNFNGMSGGTFANSVQMDVDAGTQTTVVTPR